MPPSLGLRGVVKKWSLIFVLILGTGFLSASFNPLWRTPSQQDQMSRDLQCTKTADNFFTAHKNEWQNVDHLVAGHFQNDLKKCVIQITGEKISGSTTSSKTIFYDSTDGAVLADCTYYNDRDYKDSEVCIEPSTGHQTASRSEAIGVEGYYELK